MTDDVRRILLDELVDAPVNANRMDPATYDMLVQATMLGRDLQPILVVPRDDGRYDIVDGHHRRNAARDAGYEDILAVVRPLDVSTVRALRLGMNRTRGTVDLGIARDEILALANEGWEVAQMALAGFQPAEVEDLIRSASTAVESALADAAGAAADDAAEQDKAPRPFVLEITFDDKASYVLCRRKLRKAAGKNGDLARGLLSVLGET
jgi:ParB-like chromosome segregation protein Spo0J